MLTSKFLPITIAAIALVLLFLDDSSSLPTREFYTKRFDSIAGFDFAQICLNNCAQCRKVFGDYFQSQMCSEACLQYRGRSIPNCGEISSVVYD